VITSTLLTLVVVPVIYSYLVRDRKKPATQVAGEGAQPALGGGAMPSGMPASPD
jgi:hypothetical protein